MKEISGMIFPERIIDLRSENKQDVIKEMVDVISTAPEVTDKNDFYISVMKREKILSTGIGIGLAIPHVKIPSVKDFVMALGRKKKGIDFDSLDGRPVYIVIMIGANISQRDDYIRVLAKVSNMFKDADFRKKVLDAEGPHEIMELFKTAES